MFALYIQKYSYYQIRKKNQKEENEKRQKDEKMNNNNNKNRSYMENFIKSNVSSCNLTNVMMIATIATTECGNGNVEKQTKIGKHEYKMVLI